jgi:hypothetical protein
MLSGANASFNKNTNPMEYLDDTPRVVAEILGHMLSNKSLCNKNFRTNFHFEVVDVLWVTLVAN